MTARFKNIYRIFFYWKSTFSLKTENDHIPYENTGTFHPPQNKLSLKSQQEQGMAEIGALHSNLNSRTSMKTFWTISCLRRWGPSTIQGVVKGTCRVWGAFGNTKVMRVGLGPV